MTLGQKIKKARLARKLVQRELAVHFGIETSAVGQWEIDATRPSHERLVKLGKLLQVPLDWLLSEDDSEPPPAQPQTIIPNAVTAAESATAELDPGRWPRDVPVLGIAYASEDGTFVFDTQSGPIDFVKRPPRLFGAREAYALYVSGSSMRPWREEGQLVYALPRVPVQIGDYVAAQLKDSGDQVNAGLIKRLVKRTSTHVHLEQYNPPKIIPVPLRQIEVMHKILDWSELMGL